MIFAILSCVTCSSSSGWIGCSLCVSAYCIALWQIVLISDSSSGSSIVEFFLRSASVVSSKFKCFSLIRSSADLKKWLFLLPFLRGSVFTRPCLLKPNSFKIGTISALMFLIFLESDILVYSFPLSWVEPSPIT